MTSQTPQEKKCICPEYGLPPQPWHYESFPQEPESWKEMFDEKFNSQGEFRIGSKEITYATPADIKNFIRQELTTARLTAAAEERKRAKRGMFLLVAAMCNRKKNKQIEIFDHEIAALNSKDTIEERKTPQGSTILSLHHFPKP